MIDNYVKTRAFAQSTANYVSSIISLLYYISKFFARIYVVIRWMLVVNKCVFKFSLWRSLVPCRKQFHIFAAWCKQSDICWDDLFPAPWAEPFRQTHSVSYRYGVMNVINIETHIHISTEMWLTDVSKRTFCKTRYLSTLRGSVSWQVKLRKLRVQLSLCYVTTEPGNQYVAFLSWTVEAGDSHQYRMVKNCIFVLYDCCL